MCSARLGFSSRQVSFAASIVFRAGPQTLAKAVGWMSPSHLPEQRNNVLRVCVPALRHTVSCRLLPMVGQARYAVQSGYAIIINPKSKNRNSSFLKVLISSVGAVGTPRAGG
jgi:hypothetical protein